MQSLDGLDWVLVFLVAASAIAGFMRGLIRSLCSLAGIVVGIVLAGWYAPRVGLWLATWISPPLVAQVAAFLIIAFGTMLLFALAGRLIRGACKVVGLGLADRFAGSLFGLLRGYLIVAAALLPMASFLAQTPVAQTSIFLPCFLQGAHGISFVLPRDFKDRIAASLQHLRETSR
jgi:membrane protein required for colicin V production